MDANGQCIILANINEIYLFDDIFSFCNPSLSNCIGETKIGRCGQVEPTFCTMPCITRLYGLHIVAVYIIIIFIRIYIYCFHVLHPQVPQGTFVSSVRRKSARALPPGGGRATKLVAELPSSGLPRGGDQNRRCHGGQ